MAMAKNIGMLCEISDPVVDFSMTDSQRNTSYSKANASKINTSYSKANASKIVGAPEVNAWVLTSVLSGVH
jgi:hypothetical protein